MVYSEHHFKGHRIEMRGYLRHVWAWLGFVLLLFTGIAFFDPLFPRLATAVSAISDFFLQPVWRSSAERPLLAIFFLILLWYVGASIYFRNKPISILGMSVNLYFDDRVGGAKVKVIGKRILRANTPHVSAYHLKMSPTVGKVPRTSIFCTIEDGANVKGKPVECQPHIHGYETSGWHCIYDFEPRLPYMLPLWHGFLIRRGQNNYEPRAWFTSRLATIRSEYEFQDALDKVPEYYIETFRYGIKILLVEIKFHTKPATVQAWRIKDAVVQPVKIDEPMDPAGTTYCVSASKLKNERLLITWTF